MPKGAFGRSEIQTLFHYLNNFQKLCNDIFAPSQKVEPKAMCNIGIITQN